MILFCREKSLPEDDKKKGKFKIGMVMGADRMYKKWEEIDKRARKRRVLAFLLYVIAGIHAIGGFILFVLAWKMEQEGVFRLLCFYVSLFGMVMALAVRALTVYDEISSKMKLIDVKELQDSKSIISELSRDYDNFKKEYKDPKGKENLTL